MEKLIFSLGIVMFFNVCFADERLGSITLNIEINQVVEQDGWEVDYYFSSNIEVIDFGNSPFQFIKDSWNMDEHGEMDFSQLLYHFKKPVNTLKVSLSGSNDNFIRRFYTPFIKFSDGSRAMYLGHYLPKKIKIEGEWRDIQDIKIQLSINAKENQVYFDGRTKTEKIQVSSSELKQYAFIGNSNILVKSDFDLIVDPRLPNIYIETLDKSLEEVFSYYKLKTKRSLDFRPLMMINFVDVDVKPSIDGGALNRQIAINIVGKSWAENPEENKLNILNLISHEIAHLWNSKTWASDDGSIWPHEGGANYFALNAFFDLGYFSELEFKARLNLISETCASALEKAPISKLHTIGMHQELYLCGELLYVLASKILNNEDSFFIWEEMTRVRDNMYYSEEDFIAALSHNGAPSNQAENFKLILESNEADRSRILLKLLKGYDISN